MSARTDLAAYLTTALPDYRVLPYFKALDGADKTVVMVYTSRVEQDGSSGVWIAETSVFVVSGHQDPERAEDDLDNALDATLRALAEYGPSIDAAAERESADGAPLPAYRVDLRIPYFIGKEH